MGIPGLSSLVESEPTLYFKSVKLHDTLLVIDGNCVSCWLYRLHCNKPCFNGDYKDFENCVEAFFTRLKKCNIFPIVILDGAHEARKLRTVKERMEDRILKAGRIKSTKGKGDMLTPVLLVDVFKSTLSRMNVLFCQSILEADVDISKAAEFFECPILSFDSDFYLDDVDYIPFSTLKQETCELTDCERSNIGSKYFIYGKLFDRTNFFAKFGGLRNYHFLPLLSFLLGNDYSDPKNYEAFFQRLSAQKSQLKLQQKLSVLCKWFRTTWSLEDAVNKFLEQIRPELEKKTRKELDRCIVEKNVCKSSYTVQYLQHRLLTTPGIPIPPSMREDSLVLTSECSKWMDEATSFCSSNVFYSATHAKMKIPEWMLALYIQGKAPRILMDLLVSQSVFVLTQVESQSSSSLNSSAFETLRRILGILYCASPKRTSLCINMYVRNGNRMGKQFLTPSFPETCIAVTEIPNLCLQDRENIMLDILKVERKYVGFMPNDWKLLFLTLANWCQADKSPLMLTALGCIIFSSIIVSVVDKKVGFIGRKGLSSAENSKPLKQMFDEECLLERKLESDQNEMDSLSENVISALLNIDDRDCVVAAKSFSSLCNWSNTSDAIPEKLVKQILHCFAQFQNNVIVTELLNAILNFPFTSLNIADFYHGSIAYSIYFEITEHQNLQQFIRARFDQIPTIQALFLSIVKLLEKLIDCNILAPNDQQKKNTDESSLKKKSKKVKKHKTKRKS